MQHWNQFEHSWDDIMDGIAAVENHDFGYEAMIKNHFPIIKLE